ncbi:MAG TPA: helix-turn-helix domain-containing protein [Candidatus Acidoferrum sp.]|jgi:AcrR family transcriptional regulator|nr:helix-turn-helix domain-containing protein [Candidatus Acidoferrum sp.]
MATTGRRLRADGQRSYDSIVQAAGAAFAESGTHTSLDDIAVRAGVGNATLYRHFPTRDSLLVAALRQHLSDLDVITSKLMKSADPGAALQKWFFHLANHFRTWRGLPDSVAQALRDDSSPLRYACQPLQTSTELLLHRAQQVGAARADVRPGDVFAVVSALAWAADTRNDSDADLRRMIALVLAGMR